MCFAGFASGGSLFVSYFFFSIFSGETSIGFGDAFTVTADSPLEHNLWRQTGSPGRPAFFCEGEREAANIRTERGGRGAEHGKQRNVSGDERTGTAQRCVGFGERRERPARIVPDRCVDDPADEIETEQ